MQEMIYQVNRLEKPVALDTGIYNGYEYLILSLGTHPCAYVFLSKDNENYGKDYDDIDISVHGGLTYSKDTISFLEFLEKYNAYGLINIEDKWVIGWDYAHLGDCYGVPLFEGDKQWTTEEIKDEVINVINQLNMG